MIMIAALLAVLGAGDPDAPVSTAPDRLVAPNVLIAQAERASQAASPSAAHGMTTEEQIDQWLAARSQDEAKRPDFTDDWSAPRRVHGEVTVGIGTGGYRDFAGSVVIPLGDKGALGLSYSQTENGYGYPYGYGDPVFLDGAPPLGSASRRIRAQDRGPASWNPAPTAQPFGVRD